MPRLPVRVNENSGSTGRGVTKDIADIAAVGHVTTCDVRADTNNVTGRGDAAAGVRRPMRRCCSRWR